MKCYYHPEREALAICSQCQKPLCNECEIACAKCESVFCVEHSENIGGKNYCRVCALNLRKKKSMNWFQRHLNWTFVLVAIPAYIVAFLIGSSFGYYFGTNDPLVIAGNTMIILHSIMIPLGIWILRRKNRKWPWIFILYAPFGWIIFLALENRRVHQESIESTSDKENDAQIKQDYPQTYPLEDRFDEKLCPSCGYKLDEEMDYCPNCGKKIRD